jgi:hypothetical protein
VPSFFVELSVLIATFFGLAVGSGCIYLVRAHPNARKARIGRFVFIGTLVGLGGVALYAAIMRADGLAPLGLLSGLLTVGMLWENPATAAPEEGQ